MDDSWSDVAAAGRWLLDLERTLQPDVIHLNGYTLGSLPWCAPVLMTAHSCVLSWWRAVHGHDAPASWSRYEAEVTRGLAGAALVTAPTAAMRDMLVSHYGSQLCVRVIHNGRSEMQTPEAMHKEDVVLTAGRLWDGAKNVGAVCAVASRISWPVFVAGDTQRPSGETVACRNVNYLGVLSASDMADWMRRAAIYALPARYEPFGLSVLEAAMAGCALVLGDIPSLRELWGDAATYIPPDDAPALESALSTLIGDDSLRRRMAARAQARAQVFTSRRMTDAYVDAYQELTGDIRPVLSLSAV
jgi:glycosyltransferase involved in cell wall biosynthesis